MKYDNLQYVYACLLTHSKWVNKLIKYWFEINDHFNLSPKNKLTFKKFITDQGEKILSTSIIMEKKRWREVYLTFKFLPKLVVKKDLKDHIPKNPILESVKFLDYMLNTYSNNKIINSIIQYELLRNSAWSFEFPANNQYESSFKYEISCLNYYKSTLNPSIYPLHLKMRSMVNVEFENYL